ncbi:MAG: Cof-type HAD-IIB family hydrolase [Cyanobacteria bacterium RUI128]|nr:Cof-type HAD-IIB family hydrolase [Cyanobacteria bacterium RUI128]
MIKLVATDIDGTILPYNGDFTDGVKNCINKLMANGVKVVIVTGRMFEGAKKIAQRLNLDTPIVSYNGGYVKTISGEILYERDLPPQYTAEIIDWAEQNNVHINLYADDTLYSKEDNDTIKRYAAYQQLDYKVKDFSEISFDRVHKLLAIDYNNADRVTEWVNVMSKKYPDLYIIKSTPYFCEFSTKDATKACAVNFLADYWGLKKEEVLTIGDQDNDIELLKAGGISVGMGNGTENLKAHADYITDTVDNDGFVKAIEKFVKL